MLINKVVSEISVPTIEIESDSAELMAEALARESFGST